MDNAAIGEYLKRLRLRAKYTQSGLGEILSVTDKAISRWESGTGTPELGNLIAIAKLYGITVDDILNCNESVFTAELSGNGAEIAENTAVNETVESGQAVKKKRKVLSNPWNKFCIIIFFAYILFGIYVSSYQFGDFWGYMPFYIIYIVLVVAVAVTYLIVFLIPKIIYKILTITFDCLLIANTIGLLICTVVIMHGGNTLGFISLLCIIGFALLFVMKLIYTLSQFIGDEKKVKILNYCALGVSSALLAIAGICAANCDVNLLLEMKMYEFIGVAFIISALSAVAFALGQIYSKLINVFTVIIVFVGAALPQLAYAFATQNLLFDYIFGGGTFIPSVYLISAGVSVFCVALGWLFEGGKSELTAVRVTMILATIFLLPLAYCLIDAFACFAYIGWTACAVACWLGIMLEIALIAAYVRAFKPLQLIKAIKNGV